MGTNGGSADGSNNRQPPGDNLTSVLEDGCNESDSGWSDRNTGVAVGFISMASLKCMQVFSFW